jgi:hypothetical protein
VASPTWSDWRGIPAVCLHPGHLRKTVAVALIVGTLLFFINQFDVVLAGHASTLTWLKVGLTYVVPFCVSNYGVLVATRRRPGT